MSTGAGLAKSVLAIVVVALMLAVAPAMAKARILAPVDNAGKDPQLSALIATLIKACDDKDFKPFEAALTPDAIAGFDGAHGPAGMKQTYHIDDPNTTFWADFKATLQLGGAYMDDGTFAAPYVYAAFPEDLDATSSVVAIGPKTSLYAAPNDGAAVLADVTHQILPIEASDTGARLKGWTNVWAGKAKGFVKNAEVRSPIELRAVFQKTANRWWLGAFVGGD